MFVFVIVYLTVILIVCIITNVDDCISLNILSNPIAASQRRSEHEYEDLDDAVRPVVGASLPPRHVTWQDRTETALPFKQQGPTSGKTSDHDEHVMTKTLSSESVDKSQQPVSSTHDDQQHSVRVLHSTIQQLDTSLFTVSRRRRHHHQYHHHHHRHHRYHCQIA